MVDEAKGGENIGGRLADHERDGKRFDEEINLSLSLRFSRRLHLS